MRSMMFLVLPLLAACDLAPQGDLLLGPGAPYYSMAGTWTISVAFSGSFLFEGDPTSYTIDCAGPATATMKQTTGTLSGTVGGAVGCDFTGTPGTYDMAGKVTGKRSEGGGMAWSAGRCSYTGTTPTASTAEGELVCAEEVPGGAIAYVSGTWNATRN